jgi:hypothetical protein
MILLGISRWVSLRSRSAGACAACNPSFRVEKMKRGVEWDHELADGFEDALDLFIVPFYSFFQFHQIEGQFLVRCHDFTELHKNPHYGNVDAFVKSPPPAFRRQYPLTLDHFWGGL